MPFKSLKSEYNNIKHLYLLGMSGAEIANFYNLKHSNSIRQILKKLGILRSQSEASKLAVNKGKKDKAIESLIVAAKTTNRFNPRKSNKGKDHPAYLEPGSRVPSNGYIKMKDADGLWNYEHRVVMEKKINRKLMEYEVVHHKDKNKINNHIENLEILHDDYHLRMHSIEYRLKKLIYPHLLTLLTDESVQK